MSTEITSLSTSGSETNVYRPLITSRSRRLRTTGIVLLIAVLAMITYGTLFLMPSLHTVIHALPQTSGTGGGTISRPGAPIVTMPVVKGLPASEGLTEREHRVVLAKVLFGYGYWTVCVTLLLALMVVSWLDFRELARNYDAERHRIYLQSLIDSGQSESE